MTDEEKLRILGPDHDKPNEDNKRKVTFAKP